MDDRHGCRRLRDVWMASCTRGHQTGSTRSSMHRPLASASALLVRACGPTGTDPIGQQTNSCNQTAVQFIMQMAGLLALVVRG
jgi:hypothetical protein